MLKMADACQEANKHKQTTFQEMYVQRHNNVRYAIKVIFIRVYDRNVKEITASNIFRYNIDPSVVPSVKETSK